MMDMSDERLTMSDERRVAVVIGGISGSENLGCLCIRARVRGWNALRTRRTEARRGEAMYPLVHVPHPSPR